MNVAARFRPFLHEKVGPLRLGIALVGLRLALSSVKLGLHIFADIDVKVHFLGACFGVMVGGRARVLGC